MIEMRWVCWENAGARQLEYRFVQPCVDASGGLCPGDKWTEWKRVPEVDATHPAITPATY